MIKIYTKTGDKGETSLYGGKRVSKADLRVEAYGEVDELNSAIGVAIAGIQNSKFKIQNCNSKVKSELIKIQNDLLDIGALLASPGLKEEKLRDRVGEIENLIDELSKELPELKNFILPGGGEAGSSLHLVRSVCRRAERRAVALSKHEKVNSEILVYFNRLSDLLFVMARFVNHKEKIKEVIWKR